MALWIATCPHCSAERMTFRTIAVQPFANARGNAFASCSACEKPISFRVQAVHGRGQSHRVEQINGVDVPLEKLGYSVGQCWPAQSASSAPSSVPSHIARNFVQAEEARKRAHRETAGMGYRRVLDLTVKHIAPALSGTLAKKIDGLSKAGRLTPEMSEWAHTVRELGNEAAHDEPEPTAEDVEDLAAFTEVMLEYLFSMPAKVSARKPTPPEESEGSADENLARPGLGAE